MKKGRGVSLIFREVWGADTPSFLLSSSGVSRMEDLFAIYGNYEAKFPYSQRIFKEVEAQNFGPACRQQWKGFGIIVHYQDKKRALEDMKRELEVLEKELEKQEGFRVEFED